VSRGLRQIGLMAMAVVLLLAGCSERLPTAIDEQMATVSKHIPVSIEDEARQQIEQSLKGTARQEPSAKTLKGIIVPHHLLQADLIAQAFQNMQAVDPEIIILLSPNHQEQIRDGIITVTEDLETYRGVVDVSPVAKTLTEMDIAVNEPRTLSGEYGLTYLLPYVQANQWNAEVIPIVTSRGITLDTLESLYSAIEEGVKGKRVLWIASIDFSHGKIALESRLHDAETLQWMTERDYAKILASGPEHLDNPSGLVLWLHVVQSFELTGHSESGTRSLEALDEAGTSYMFFQGR